MFEKDAKNYAIGLTYPKFQDNQVANIVLRDVEGAFQKGAEFGYNKANEWHYPSKGELPEKDNCLCIGYFGNDDYAICKVKGGRFWISSCGWLDFEDATAWRYIEPPKEEE